MEKSKKKAGDKEKAKDSDRTSALHTQEGKPTKAAQGLPDSNENLKWKKFQENANLDTQARQDTQEDGLPDVSEDHSENANESPQQQRQEVISQPIFNERDDLREASKWAIHVCTRDSLKKISKKDRKLAKYQIDSVKNVYALYKACQGNDAVLVSMLIDFGADINC